jgi:hypothetical protein
MNDPRQIGRIRHVLGSTVTVELDASLAGVAPIWEGLLQPVGQLGSLVRIPQGPVTIVASVTLIGVAELAKPLPPSSAAPIGDRWLQAQLLGEVDSLGVFHRGVGTYPGLDDPVLFATNDDLRAVFPAPGPGRVRIGRVASAADTPVTLDASRLIVRHGAIVGSTGAGKSSAASLLLQQIASQWPAANVVVVDPHGEYQAALGASARVLSVLGSGETLLPVPYWALPATDIITALVGTAEGATTRSIFGELVTKWRREYAEGHPWVTLPLPMIGPDTPIPFDIRQVWHALHYENSATYAKQNGEGAVMEKTAGDANTLTPTTFEMYGLGAASPFRGPRYGVHGSFPDRLRLRLKDPRFGFLLQPDARDAATADPLLDVVCDWLGADKPVSVLDFSGVPSEAADLAIGLVLQLILELAVRGRGDGIGRARPVLVVLEEAHRYLGEAASVRAARDAANRIAREGRKHGVGLLLVTQRPSELPPTALSQVGTIIALRLTNGGDQSTVRAALPDSIAGLADALPSLRTGEAIVAGEAIALPTRVQLDPPSPWPSASDPDLNGWEGIARVNDLAPALGRWRGEGEGEAGT